MKGHDNAFGPTDVVKSIIEGPFMETTRNGKNILCSVLLTLTPGVLLITESRLGVNSQESDRKCIRIPNALYFIDSLKVTVFKKSQRQTLKVCFGSEHYRYFEMDKTFGKKAMWTMWCKQVVEIQRRSTKLKWLENISTNTISLDWNIVNKKWQPQHFVWNDKYLYLGSKREFEDQSRPSPVPGLGRAENIRLLYLKPQYFGCWDQSEHWVQCESSKHLNTE